MTDEIEDRLRAALVQARTDDRLGVAARTTSVESVHRAGRTRRRRARAAAATAALVVLSTGTAVVVGASGGGAQTLGPASPAAPALPQVAPAPGITPAFVPRHGRDWLLTDPEAQAFEATHVLPSPEPGEGTVPSPAPLGPRSERLETQVRTASAQGVVPAALLNGMRAVREDDAGGRPDLTALHLTLAGDMAVKVQRLRFPFPERLSDLFEQAQRPGRLVDVPGTTAVAFDISPGHAREVGTVAADGQATLWSAPPSLPLDLLWRWAVATEQAAHGG